MKRIYVEWDDSTADGPWADPDALALSVSRPGALRCHSVGFVAREDEATLTLAMSYTLDKHGEVSQWGQPLTIPKVAITKRKPVPG